MGCFFSFFLPPSIHVTSFPCCCVSLSAVATALAFGFNTITDNMQLKSARKKKAQLQTHYNKTATFSNISYSKNATLHTVTMERKCYLLSPRYTQG